MISVNAATLILSDGSSMSKVKVISINFSKKIMVIESDGQQRTISTGRIKEFYSNDLKLGTGSADIDNTSEYSVTIMNVDMPKTGYKKTGKKNKYVTTNCEIEYTLSVPFPKKDDTTNRDIVKYPYFYLAVLTEGSSEYGSRPVFRYTYPSKFKIKSKNNYNTAEIMEAVNSLKRPRIHLDRVARMGRGSVSGQREIKIKLSKINSRKIIAYHLEVWGKDKLITSKDWKDPGTRISEKWLKRWWFGH
jgi:hypothetical protein